MPAPAAEPGSGTDRRPLGRSWVDALSVRARLTMATTGVVALALAVGALLLTVVLHGMLLQQRDDTAREQASGRAGRWSGGGPRAHAKAWPRRGAVLWRGRGCRRYRTACVNRYCGESTMSIGWSERRLLRAVVDGERALTAARPDKSA